MKDINTKEGCVYLDQEIEYLKETIVIMKRNLLLTFDQLAKLENIRAQLLCPSDFSEEEFEANKKLIDSLNIKLSKEHGGL